MRVEFNSLSGLSIQPIGNFLDRLQVAVLGVRNQA
jgi:hypothetical protein